MDRPDLVITHGGCWDGLVAAWAIVSNTGCETVHYANHGQDPPDVRGKHVLCVDFAYPREATERMAGEAASLTILDHHATTARDLEGLPYARFDMDKSGARLAWEHTCDRPPPWIVAYCEDADLWRYELPGSREARAFYKSFPMTLRSVEQLAWEYRGMPEDGGVPIRAIQLGEPILRADAQHVSAMCDASFEISVGGHRASAAWAPVLFADVREELLRRHEWAALGVSIRRRPDGAVEFGVGSRDGSPHCGEIAKEYGGGGHPGAAGFLATPSRLPLLGVPIGGDAEPEV